MNKCALFLDADPLTKADKEIVKRTIKLYGHVSIILRRRNQNHKHMFSYADKLDMICHDFNDICEDCYDILPNDGNGYDVLKDNGINVLAVKYSRNTDLYQKLSFMELNKLIVPECQMILMPSEESYLNSDIKQLAFIDKTLNSIVSEYSLFKMKQKLTTKIGLFVNEGNNAFKVLETFQNRNSDVCNIDSKQDVIKQIAKKIESTDKKTVVFACNANQFEDCKGMFDITIGMYMSKEMQLSRLLNEFTLQQATKLLQNQLDNSKLIRLVDYQIDDNHDTTTTLRNAIDLIDRKLKI